MLVPLLGGAYEARSIIADAQRCVNLFPERNPQDSPAPFTHYPTPGLVATGNVFNKPPRWEYLASNGNMYTVVGDATGSELWVSVPSTTSQGIGTTTLIGSFTSVGTTPVSMADNGIVLIIVDGSVNGWVLDLTDPTFANFGVITDPNFPGAAKVDYLDTFLIFNTPNTNQWFISLSESNYSMFTGIPGAILTGTISPPSGPGSYTNGTYLATPLTGGTGTGATADITVSGNFPSMVIINSPGTAYSIGDVLSATLPGTSIATGSISAGGSSYTDGNYSAQALTGGTGSGATANLTVSGGTVTSLTIVDPGVGYNSGDVLSSALPTGSGFTFTVVSTQGFGFVYTVNTISGQAFDPLDVSAKTGYPDDIVGLIVMDLYIWLLGKQTSEIWFNAGAADFPFQIFPGVFIEHGCAAVYSIAKQDLSVYWLSTDKQGQCIVLKGNNFAAHRISTYAIENEFSSYGTISDAIGWTYQQNGHTFYVLTFPAADKTWVYDESSELWHERASLQTVQSGQLVIDGALHKVLYHNTGAVCGGLLYSVDDLGNQYQIDPDTYTDNGSPITRIRSFPHQIKDQRRVTYTQFIADMETGTDDGTDGSSSENPPMVSLRWSDDRGRTYSSYVQQSLGAIGQYIASIKWWRLGMARDRVFELSWSIPAKTALNGAWVETIVAGT